MLLHRRRRGDEEVDLLHRLLELTLPDLAVQIRTPRYAMQQQCCLCGRVLLKRLSGFLKLHHVFRPNMVMKHNMVVLISNPMHHVLLLCNPMYLVLFQAATYCCRSAPPEPLTNSLRNLCCSWPPSRVDLTLRSCHQWRAPSLTS